MVQDQMRPCLSGWLRLRLQLRKLSEPCMLPTLQLLRLPGQQIPLNSIQLHPSCLNQLSYTLTCCAAFDKRTVPWRIAKGSQVHCTWCSMLPHQGSS